MNNLNSNILTFFTFSFLIISLLMYYIFTKKLKNFFNWKRNLIIISLGLVLSIVLPIIANISNDINSVFIIGTIVSAPVIAYSLASTKVFLAKNKNLIKTKE